MEEKISTVDDLIAVLQRCKRRYGGGLPVSLLSTSDDAWHLVPASKVLSITDDDLEEWQADAPTVVLI